MKKKFFMMQIPDYRIKKVSEVQKQIIRLGKLSCLLARLFKTSKIARRKFLECSNESLFEQAACFTV